MAVLMIQDSHRFILTCLAGRHQHNRAERFNRAKSVAIDLPFLAINGGPGRDK